MAAQDQYSCRTELKVWDKSYQYYDLHKLEEHGLGTISKLPFFH